MKLLICISYYYPNISGLSIYAKRIAEEMVKKGFEVEVLTSRHKNELPCREKVGGVLIKRVWTPFILGRGPIMPTFLIDSLRAVMKADIINCHLPQFEAIFTALWAKILGKKLIVTYHCDLSNWPGFVDKVAVGLTYFSQFLTCILADRIINSSKDYSDNSKFLKLFKKELVYIFPPVKLEKSLGTFINKWGSVKYKIGFVGRIAKEKGIDVLLNAIPDIEKGLRGRFKIFIVGPKNVIGGGADGQLSNTLEKYDKYLIYLGTLKDGEMPDFYKMLNVLVLPSTQSMEAFGMVQVEAMLSGCPVIASDLPGVRIPIKLTGMGEVIEIKDSNLLGQAIVKVLRNKKGYIKPKDKIEKIFDYRKTINFYSNSAFAEE